MFEASARVLEDKALVGGKEIPLEDLNPTLMMSLIAACLGKKVKEATGSELVEVKIEVYADIDKILDGREEIEYIEVKVRSKGPREEILKGVDSCPVFGLVDRVRIKSVEVLDSEG